MEKLEITKSKDVAPYIDHTLLKADATEKDIAKICKEANKYGFASICVNPSYVKFAKKELGGSKSKVKVCTVIGFPLGATPKEVKAFEAEKAIKDGAKEVDMVLNIGAMKSKDYDTVLKDVRSVVKAANKKAIVKVILENCYLTKTEIKKATEICLQAKADFVKTSTGVGTGGALAEDVAIMSKASKGKMEVKASGGIRSFSDAKKMLDAGATRIGCGASSSIAIITGQESDSKGY